MSLSFSDAAKAKKLREYFARHGRIYIVVNAALEEVEVPGHFRGDPALRLVLNTRMPQPILIHDDMLESDFSFSGQVYPCRIPMHAIWAAYLPEGDLEQGIIWDDSVPEMIRSLVSAVRRSMHDDDDDDEAAPPSRPLSAISGGGNKAAGNGREGKKDKPRKVGHLRVIK